MAKYTRSTFVSGGWVKTSELKSSKAKIVSETNPQPSNFLDNKGNVKNQEVCKVLFQGMPDPLNVALNRTTINALVDAFGEDSKDWMNKILSVKTEKTRTAGRSSMALYLIPDGYKMIDDVNGYAVIVKDTVNEPVTAEVNDEGPNFDEGEANPDDIPF